MNLLISSAGRRVALLQAFQKELKQILPENKVFACDIQPEYSAACQVADAYFTVPRLTEKNFISQISEKCLENNIKLIIPTLDTELPIYSANKSIFKENGIDILVSNPELVAQCADKRLSANIFETRGIRTPTLIDKQKLSFPLFIKPSNGSMSKGVKVVLNEKELCLADLENENLLFFEYISPASGYEELSIDVYFNQKSELCCAVPRKRIEARAGEVSKAQTIRNNLYERIVQVFGVLEGAKGVLTIQVFYRSADHDLIGVEINPRFGGGFPLSYQAGANYPKWLIQEYFFGERILFFDNWQKNLKMLRHDSAVWK